jgi:hypothetical protein
MIGFTMTASHIDYSKIISPEMLDDLILGECIIIEGFAKELVPVDKGQLKNSIMTALAYKDHGFNQGGGPERAPDDAQLVPPDDDKEGFVGSGLVYAGPVEYGRQDMPAYPKQPYLRPAVDYSKSAREARRRKAIQMAIKQAYHG